MPQVNESHSGQCCGEGGGGAAFLPRDAGQLAMLVSRLSGQSVEKLTSSLFEAHPGMPPGLQLPVGVTIEALSDVQAIVSHGTACGICLQDVERAIQYSADGLALYAVTVKGRIEGTIALSGYGCSRYQNVLVYEVAGVDNAEPSAELSHSAQALADAWTTDEQMAAWLAYDRACERWKQSLD